MTDEPRIVDVVFARSSRHRRRTRTTMAVGAGLGAHLAIVVWALVSTPSLETWSAELATRVHAELTREEVVELPPPTEKPPLPVEKTVEPETPRTAPRVPRFRLSQPPSPAQAGKIVTADPAAAVDLPGTSFVTGTAATYAGGVTSSTGKSQTAVLGPVAEQGAPAGEGDRDRSTTVSLDSTEWSCPWPREADAQSIDEQSVILQATVGSDGKAESVKILSDPGHGFGAAARACALTTRFSPAHDRAGQAMRAESPPIRVHFTR